MKKGIKDVFAPQGLFEDLGLKYIGPVDGHDEDLIENALQVAKRFNGPVMVHVITEKGKCPQPMRLDLKLRALRQTAEPLVRRLPTQGFRKKLPSGRARPRIGNQVRLTPLQLPDAESGRGEVGVNAERHQFLALVIPKGFPPGK
jgi:hypothetical protein